MNRLLDGDPLGLEERSCLRRDELAHLIASERVYMRSAARVAYGACVHGVDEPVDAWIAGRIDQAIAELLREDERAARAKTAVEADDEFAYVAVMELLDVSAENARVVCVAFNSLPFATRSSWFEYSIEQWRLAELAAETGVTDEVARGNLGRALLRILRGVR